MTLTTRFFGTLPSTAADIYTYDNVSLFDILQDVDEDMDVYTRQINEFFDPLSETSETISKVVNYYEGEVQSAAEGSRPEADIDKYVYEQGVAWQRFEAALQLTNDAIALMTAEEVAAMTQAKLKGFQKERFRALRTAIFTNTTRNVPDYLGQYQAVTVPFFNLAGNTGSRPMDDYTFQAGDLQHFNAVASANAVTLAEVQNQLIDKVAHHGYNSIEIWISKWDRNFVERMRTLGAFTPSAEVIGSNDQIRTRSASGSRLQRISPWEGLVGFVEEVPVIKSPVVPLGYAMAIGIDGGPGRAPFLSRQIAVPAFRGLKVEQRNTSMPLADTVMKDGWGYAPNHRGAVAVLRLNGTTYAVPAL